LAALFLTFYPTHLVRSQEGTPYTAQLFFALLSFLFIARIYKRGKTRDYVLAGLCAGIATAIQYNVLFLRVPLSLAHFLHGTGRGHRFRRVLLAATWLALAVSLGRVITTGLGSLSLGTMLRAAWPSMLFLVLFLFLSVADPDQLRHILRSTAKVSLWQVLFTLILSSIVAYVALEQFGAASTLTFPIMWIAVLGSVCLSLFLSITRDSIEGLVLSMLVLPLLGMVQWEYRNFRLPKPRPWGRCLCLPLSSFRCCLLSPL